MDKYFLLLISCFISSFSQSQETLPQEPSLSKDSFFNRNSRTSNEPSEKVKLVHSDFTKKLSGRFGGNTFLQGNVEVTHKGSRLKADTIVIYDKQNFVKAKSRVTLVTKDGNRMNCGELEYDTNSGRAIARDRVVLSDPQQTIKTDILYYDRDANTAYFNTGGTIQEGGNIIYSDTGIYYLNEKRMLLDGNYNIDNESYIIKGDRVDYFREIQKSVFRGPTFIENKKDSLNHIYTEKGYYLMKTKEIFLEEASKIHYNEKILSADNIYFNQLTGFGRAENNVKLDDPKEKRYIKGNYGEIYQKKDSAVITEKPYVVKLMDKDSLYLSAKKIVVFQRSSNDSVDKKKSFIRASPQARIYKSDTQVRSDSISFNETDGTIDFIGNPILWYQEKQITGDTLKMYLNKDGDKMDSLKAINNAFTISKADSLNMKNEFNQAKGKMLTAIFEEGKMKKTLLTENVSAITYVDEENGNHPERIGFSLSTCGEIIVDFQEGKVKSVSCNINANNDIYPMSQVSPKLRFFDDFNWNTKDRLRKWADIFLDTPNYPEIKYVSDDSLYENTRKKIEEKEAEEDKKNHNTKRPRKGNQGEK